MRWIYLAKDLWSRSSSRGRGEIGPADFAAPYLGRGKVRAIFAADDPLPALARLAYLRAKLALMRVALLDPPNFTPPYDHRLASALPRAATTSTSSRRRSPRRPAGPQRLPTGGDVPPAERTAPAAVAALALARAVKGLEYGPSVLASAAASALHPTSSTCSGSASRATTYAGCGAPRLRYPTVLTAHDVLPRREGRARLGRGARGGRPGRRPLLARGRPARRAGVARERLALIPHPVFDARLRAERAAEGKTLLFFGLIRSYKGVDVLSARCPRCRARARGAARRRRRSARADRARPGAGARLGVDRVDWRLRFCGPTEIPALLEEAAVTVLPYRGSTRPACSRPRSATGDRSSSPTSAGSARPCASTAPGASSRPRIPSALRPPACELLTDPEALAAATRGPARRDALTWDAAAEQHERVYRELVA